MNHVNNFKSILKTFKSIVEEFLPVSSMLLQRKQTAKNQSPSKTIVIAPPGAGNIGDQAMIESLLENVEGHITVVARNADDFIIPNHYAERTSIIDLPNLLYGFPNANFYSDLKKLLNKMEMGDQLFVIGADIMDGAYSSRSSIRRAAIAGMAAGIGIESRILGFSWNASPKVASKWLTRTVSKRGVKLFLRDPVSYERAIGDGLHNSFSVVDTVFSSTRVESHPIQEELNHRALAIVNISGHIQKSYDQLEAYKYIIRNLIDDGYQVILLPHVIKKDSDDLELTMKIYESMDQDHLHIYREISKPAAVRGLVRQAEIIVTGRMHLAIIGLSQGVPAVVLASQGKVEGLVRLLPESSVCVEPSLDMATAILSGIEALKGKRVPAITRSNLEALSRLNFDNKGE